MLYYTKEMEHVECEEKKRNIFCRILECKNSYNLTIYLNLSKKKYVCV